MTFCNRLTAIILRSLSLIPVTAALCVLGGCGGGGTGGTAASAVPPTVAALAIVPSSVTVFLNTPQSITVTGGVAPYQVLSNNVAILHVSQQGPTTFSLLDVAAVTASTTVTVTALDAAGHTASAAVTVQPPATGGPLAIIPGSNVQLYFNTPQIMVVTGGLPPYRLLSSNSAILPISGAASNSGNFLLLANNVTAASPVTLTATDSSGQSATTAVTIEPAPLLNKFTVTPTLPSPAGTCGQSSVCSGLDGLISVQLQNVAGGSLSNRLVQFDVVQGNYTLQSGNPPVPVNSVQVLSDQSGTASVRVFAAATAPTQVALIRATDIVTGNTLTGSFPIQQSSGTVATLAVFPSTATINGPDKNTCSSNVPVTYYIYGGTPPYTVAASFPTSVGLQGSPVLTNGGGFTVTTSQGICLNPLNLVITDSQNRVITALLNNLVGNATPPSPAAPVPLAVTPTSSILQCNQSGTFTIIGGNGFYVTSVSNTDFVTALLTGQNQNTLTITRKNTDLNVSGAGTTQVTVGISDGSSTLSIPLTVPAHCPVGGSLTVTPNAKAVACGTPDSGFSITGGTGGPYNTLGLPSGFLGSTVVGNVLTVLKQTGANNTSAAFSITDGITNVPVTITGSGAPASCP